MTDKPTAEDMGRSLEADLKLCEAAGAGPWSDDGNTSFSVLDAGGKPVAFCYGPRQPYAYGHGKTVSWQVVEFIVSARTGWPSAIRRALAAEAEAARLRAANGKLRQALEEYLSSINEDNAWPCDDDHGGIWIDCQSDRVQELATAAEEALESQP